MGSKWIACDDERGRFFVNTAFDEPGTDVIGWKDFDPPVDPRYRLDLSEYSKIRLKEGIIGDADHPRLQHGWELYRGDSSDPEIDSFVHEEIWVHVYDEIVRRVKAHADE